jgi:hypothetical protein
MATSQEAYQELMDIQNRMNPLLSDYASAPTYLREQINKMFLNNEPLIKERAAQEQRAYTLPGELMGEYSKEYGQNGIGGASGMNRLNSILGRLGSQFGNVDVASGLMDRQGQRIDTMVGDLTKQYGLMLDAMQNQYGMKKGMYDSLVGQEEAEKQRQQQMALARRSGGGSSSSGFNLPGFIDALKQQAANQSTPVPTVGGRAMPAGAIGTNADGSYMYPQGAIGMDINGNLIFPKSQSLTGQYQTPKSSVNSSTPLQSNTSQLLKGGNSLFSKTSKLFK